MFMFNDLKKEFVYELSLFDKQIKKILKIDIMLIDDITTYSILHKGKLIRPLMTMLFGKIFHVDLYKIITASVSIELIHIATLLHDDVVDFSSKRRGKLSVNKAWGNKESVLVGDFLYTKSFRMMIKLNNMDVLKLMSYTTNIMSKGEIMQLIHKNNLNIQEDDYFNIIRCKTANLFASTGAVAVFLSESKEFLNDIFNYGLNLGIAFQLIDDILDYFANSLMFGKNMYDDICNGTFTLPLIYYINNIVKGKAIIKNFLNTKHDLSVVLHIKDEIIRSGAIDYTFDLAKKHAILAKKSLSRLNRSKYIEIAYAMVDFIINRRF